ncbi:SusC/RagA family TonB-linked outer membrane protein [Sphingobacterium sp. 1.A.5]|jgi:TonB-linked SusC/RagA family outer membrane protein|uniref:SusC/RagA family TonB-linked outer membrane protein n=1 Tax=Sphingobacterium sp. 1.A.5 TaxID=2044604 RepID=UPI000C0BC1FE|nr:SusC/RagA family TonB-linked outer membrane protein [Sphingobacterium sp. 1.A.5]
MKLPTCLSIAVASLCSIQMLSAQQLSIAGKVTNANGEPIAGASIFVKGTQTGTASNENGLFNLNAPSDGTLQIRAVGYAPLEVPIAGKTNFNVQLQQVDDAIDEVVVTALGIERNPKSLGYGAQGVNSATLNANKQSNLVNALQGKIAGANISSTGGAPGQGANIQIRGINSIDPTRPSQPLFVIDGILMDNSTSTQGGTAEVRGMSNRAVDINPDDIETINILKGGAATALYGLRGANGVVVITTKSGKAGTIKIDYQGTVGFENVNKFPKMQDTYSQGWQGVYNKDDFWPAFGPTVEEAIKLDPTHPAQLYKPFEEAFDTGNQFRNSLSFSGGSEKFTFLTSISQLKHNGVLPATDFKNLQARLNTNFTINEKLKGTSSISVNNSGGYRGNANRYAEQLIYWSPRHNIRDYVLENGTMNSYGETDNPIYIAHTNRFKDDVLRVIGGFDLTYSPAKWVDLMYRIGVDTYRDDREATAIGYQGLTDERIVYDNGVEGADGRGFYNVYNNNYRALNSTFIATFKHQFNEDFGGKVRVGQDIYDQVTKRNATEGGDLTVYDWFDLGNANILKSSSYNEKYRLMGFFGELEMTYKDYLFLTLTSRTDITSTLNPKNRAFTYNSASLSYVFSDHIKLPEVINFSKLRLSYAGIGKDAAPYSTSKGFGPYTSLPTGYIGFTRPALLGDENLKPEFTNTIEAGLEMKFYNSRLGFDLNFYNSVSKDQIIKVPVTSTTGYVTAAINAGSIRNRGLEITLNTVPVKKENFTWNSDINFSFNRNKVLEIREDLDDEIVVSSEFGYLSSTVSMRIKPGESYGTLYGRTYKRYYTPEEIEQGLDKTREYDDSRPLLIGANGFPVLESTSVPKKLGNVQPSWIGGWNNTFNYKSLSLNVLFDARVGQYRYNQLGNFMAAFGEADYTENRNDYTVFDGVTADGNKNTKEVWLGQGKDPKNGVNYGNGYYRDYYRGNSQFFVEDASWLRLRSVSIGYGLPQQWLENKFIKNARISVTGNNLLLWTKYSGYDPENSTTASGSNIEGFAGMTYPAVRSFLFSLNVGF